MNIMCSHNSDCLIRNVFRSKAAYRDHCSFALSTFLHRLELRRWVRESAYGCLHGFLLGDSIPPSRPSFLSSPLKLTGITISLSTCPRYWPIIPHLGLSVFCCSRSFPLRNPGLIFMGSSLIGILKTTS